MSEVSAHRAGYVVADGFGLMAASPAVWSDRRLCEVTAETAGQAWDMVDRQLDGFAAAHRMANPSPPPAAPGRPAQPPGPR